MGKRVLLVDVGAVSKYTAFSMMSGGEPCIMPTAGQEAIRRFAKLVYGEYCRAKADIVIFAMDRKPYWRTDWLKAWYKDHATCHVGYLQLDNSVIRLEDGKRMTQKELKDIVLEESDWTEEHERMVPRYKGNREDKAWPLADLTPADLDNCAELAVKGLAARLSGLVVAIQGWEADDIAAVYCAEAPSYVDKVTLVTLDSDWRQLIIADHRVEVSDIRLGEVFGQDHLDQAKWDLRAKIVGGDRSDNLAGLPKGNSGCWGKDGAVKITKDGLPSDLDKESLLRNATLMRLPCPLWDLEERWEALKASASKVPAIEGQWEHLYLTERDIQECGNDSLVRAWLLKVRGSEHKAGQDE